MAASTYGQTCGAETAGNDGRCTMEATAYIGLAIDTFAAGATRRYLNPGAAGGKEERAAGGLDFAYRLRGWRYPKDHKKYPGDYRQQTWVYGETVHGVRSTDIDCSENADFPTCAKSFTDIGQRPAENLLYILRNASSLEGYVGLRWEFLPLNNLAGLDGTPANLYFKAEAGFLRVSGQPDSALAMHRIALGAIASKGIWQNSYLEAGWGRSDVFQVNRRRRLRVDGYLSRQIAPAVLDGAVSFFARINVDTDLGPGADSIQSYVGFNFNIGKLLGKPKPADGQSKPTGP